jgi:RNA polymerase sigma-70 factor (ECF subfamily)
MEASGEATPMDDDSSETMLLLQRARAGDREALGALFARHQERLRRMVRLRLDPRLQARLDASDVLQEAFLEIAARLEEYLREPKLPLFLWLRLLVGQRLAKLHRHHLGTQKRTAAREISLEGGGPSANSGALAAQLLGVQTSPTQAAVRAERLRRLEDVLNGLDPLDREVLALRHFEELNRAETAQVLGITEAAAAKRYLRALKRLKEALADLPGGL